MKSRLKYTGIGFGLTLGLSLITCFEIKAQTTADIKIVKDLPALSRVYYSIDEGKTITGTDTATAKWDMALQRTGILVNSGSSGKGATTAQILKNTSFDKVTIAPPDGYTEDTAQSKAMPTGSGQGWYLYDMTNHTVNPAPGRVIVVKTASGKYAKLEILNYYKNGDGEAGYYTFRYAFINKSN
ncbi:HmuY family protein [Mucilaginibacter roseus]|uniref:HmuY family protein n=1 Tax=Mucilaginibacter roseus TaxID=1528868 RepID=A0ABS8U2X5_9SPHI|nr:HmuY family protein [Mucilaginibacter roseus]MCD8740992.1 HmuY family protein [Mucilaginibacter roseus]